jgi:hypothetical protein
MAKRAADQEEAEAEEPVTHPEEIRLEAALTIGGRPTARAALRTTPAGVICAGLAVAAIILSSAAVVKIVGRTVR